MAAYLVGSLLLLWLWLGQGRSAVLWFAARQSLSAMQCRVYLSLWALSGGVAFSLLTAWRFPTSKFATDLTAEQIELTQYWGYVLFAGMTALVLLRNRLMAYLMNAIEARKVPRKLQKPMAPFSKKSRKPAGKGRKSAKR